MAKFTLLEVHLDESTFTANAPFSSSEETAAPEEEEEGGGSSTVAILGTLIGLVFLTAIALAVKKKLGGSDDEAFVEEEEQIELGDVDA